MSNWSFCPRHAQVYCRTGKAWPQNTRCVMAEHVLIVDLGLDATNYDLLDQMRVMKRAREERFYPHVVAQIRGFGDDPRELYDIPEVRAFCRRLVNLGFVSYLEVTTLINPKLPAE